MANLAGTYSSSRSYYPYLDYTISAYEYSRTASTVTYRCSASVSIASSGGYGFDIYLNYNIGGVTGSKTLKTTSGGFPSSTGSFDVTVSGVSAAGGTNTVSASMWSSSSNDSTHWQNSFNTGTRYLDTSSFNRPPVINSVTLAGISEGNTIWENTSSVTVNYSSSDPDGNITSYEIIRYVNNASNATFSSTTGSYKDSTISSVTAGATVKYRVRAKDAYNEWSSEKWSPSFKINSLTGAKLTSSNPGISWQSTSMVFSYSGASNTNGDGNFKYHFLNDAGIPMYNNTPKSTFSSNQIDIEGWGITDAERACIKSSDLINFVKSTTNRTKTFNLTLRTTNSAGTYKDSVITVTVSLKPKPAALSISALAGKITASGIARYVPNVSGTYTLSWGASSDLTGGSGLSYEVQANFNNGGWYVVQSLIQGTSVDISSDVKRYSINSAAATYKLRVRAYTVYGTETLSEEQAYTLDYWYPPTISIGKMQRLNSSYSVPITANVNSSFATITTASWSGNGASGNLTKAGDNKTATGTASQSISATTSFTLTATIVDNSGLTGATQTDKQTVPRYQPIISMRSLGLGVNAYASANYIFRVGGNARIDGNLEVALPNDTDPNSLRGFVTADMRTAGITGSPGQYYQIQSFGVSNRSLQLGWYYGGGNILKYRELNSNNSTWSDWADIYSTANKPTPADIGALASNWLPTTAQINAIGAELSQYWGMTTPTGANNAWIRTTSSGILPNSSNGSNGYGNGNVGAGSWRFQGVFAYDGDFSNSITTPTVITNTIKGRTSASRFYLGESNGRFDATSDNYVRMYNPMSGTADTGSYWSPYGGMAIKVNGVAKHDFMASGTKTGGSIEIDGMTYGMAPTDSPRSLIEDIFLDIEINGEQRIDLNPILARTLHKYGVFPSSGKVEIILKEKEYFIAKSNELCKCDFRLVGTRIDVKDQYYLLMGGITNGDEKVVSY